MDKPKEQVIAEEATGCEQQGNIVFYDDNGNKLSLIQAVALALSGQVIEIPAAGAGSYREIFTSLGYEDVKVINDMSSAGDWSFGVKNSLGWAIAHQENRYPYHGYKYSINITNVCNTFEELCEMVENY